MNDISRTRSIFVQIPSYRDNELIPTLVDIIAKASEPRNLHISVCWQHGEDEALSDFELAGFDHVSSSFITPDVIHVFEYMLCVIKIIDVDFLATGGCGWARNRIQRYFDNEIYALQLDSHHRFVAGWDISMIEMLESLRSVSRKPVLTGYPPAYEPGNERATAAALPLQMNFLSFGAPGLVHFKPEYMQDWENRTTPMRARFLSGGFIFSDSKFITEVPNDANQFFSSEEIATAVRAYTRGYDFFHPHQVLLWHQYARISGKKVWDDHSISRKLSGQIQSSAIERSYESYNRTRTLFGLECDGYSGLDFGEFGIGGERTLKDYERFSGLSFVHEGVTREVLDGTEPSEQDICLEDERWLEKLVCKVNFEASLSCTDLTSSVGTNSTYYLKVVAADGSELLNTPLEGKLIEELRREGAIQISMSFAVGPFQKPKNYLVHSKAGL